MQQSYGKKMSACDACELLELVLLAIAIDGDALLGLWDSGF